VSTIFQDGEYRLTLTKYGVLIHHIVNINIPNGVTMKASDYEVGPIRHKETGEEITIEEFIDLYLAEFVDKKYFELANPFMLAGMLDLIPHTGAKVLAYLFRNKGPGNMIQKQNQEIAKDLGIGINSVGRIMTIFVKNGMLKKKDRGLYMMDPSISCYGGKNKYRSEQKWREMV
jgi:hypothetical protein